MEVLDINGGIGFSRNPIVVKNNWSPADTGIASGIYRIEMYGKNIYEGRFIPPLSVDIAEILDANAQFLPDIPINSELPVIRLEDDLTFNKRRVKIHIEYNSDEDSMECMVIPGGISNRCYRTLSMSGTDIFKYRFLNPNCNFFLTNRTQTWRITIPETELYPLYFIVDHTDSSMVIEDPISGNTLLFNDIEPGAYALNIDRVRRIFFDNNHILTNIFNIYRENKFACQIVIEISEPHKESYIVKFRNSLGVFELIELCGSLSVIPNLEDSENKIFKAFDGLTNGFSSSRDRIEVEHSLKIDIPIPKADRLTMLLDMVSSEDVYMLNLSGTTIKVIPSIDDAEYALRQVSPGIISLKFDTVYSEKNLTSYIPEGASSEKGRIFSPQFSPQFN